MGTNLLTSLMMVLGNALIAGLGLAVNKGIGYLKTKNSHAVTSGVLERVSQLSLTVVKDVFQSYVVSLKNSGSFDAQAQATAKSMAISAVKRYLGNDGVHQLVKILGSDSAVTSFLASSIEAALADFKVKQVDAASATVPVNVHVATPPPSV